MIPFRAVAHLSLNKGPPAIRTEKRLTAAYIYVDMRGRDIDGYVRDAKQVVQQAVKFPAGYYIAWSGQFEYMERAKQRLQLVVPLTLCIIFVFALSQLRPPNRNPYSHAIRTLRAGRRHLATVVSGL